MEEDGSSPPLGKAFGVNLRKVRSSIIEQEALERRRSISPTNQSPPSDNNKAEKRRSTPSFMYRTKPSDLRSKVAMRQEAAEQKAIERRKAERKSNSLTNRPVSSIAHSHDSKHSRSMDNIKQHLVSKPVPPPKPKHLGQAGIVRPIRGTKRKSSTDTDKPETDAEALIGGSSEIGLEDTAWAYPLFRKLLDQSSVLAKHVGGAMKTMRLRGEEYWRFYWTSIEEESSCGVCDECNEPCSCSRLRGPGHGHRFITVSGVQTPIICDLCANILWSRYHPYRKCIVNKTKREVRPSSLDKDQQPRVVPNPAYSATSPTIDQYLAYVLSDMAASSKDESDYANLWDTKSRDTGSSYSTNQVVMDSIMRSKVNRTNSRDYAKRQAWRLEGNSASSSTENIADLLTDNNRSSGSFDMKKFESLKARVDNMDLKLFDFDHLSDLKHSSSLLELSTMLKSASSSDCNYTCHEGCEEKVHEQCQGADVNLLSKGDQSMACEDVDDTDSGYSGSGRSAGFTLSKEEIISRIKTYNESHGGSTTALKLSSDGSDVFQGVIQVYISLEKPIHMSLKSRPTSIYEALDRKAELSPSASPENTMSACQLPQDAPVSLHINSINKATEVVSMLLKKFNITDNPKTFALYEQSVEQEQEVKLRKIGDVELPLLNFLRWSTENQECSRRFVLKEHNSAEILWEAFSLPELKNFLRMFNAEESQGKDAIRAKYKLQQTQLLQRLSEINTEKRS